MPLEAIYNIDIDRIEVNTGLGKGSAIERKINLDRLNGELYYRLEPQGQRLIDRMVAAEYGGSRLARLLVPAQPGLNPPIDVQIANLENNQIIQGMTVPVEPNQNHAAHIQVHLGVNWATSTRPSVTSNFPLEQAIPQMYPLWQHTGQHLQMLDPQNPMLKPWKQTLEVMGEVIVNGQKHLDAQAQKAQRQQAKLQQQGGGQPQQPGDQTQTLSTQGASPGGGEFEQMPSSVYREAVKAQTMLSFLQQKQQMELQHNQDKHQQDMAFEDAKTAQTLRNQQLTG